MQTFLPLPSFTDSAKVLDRQRLGKQRVEAKQILQILRGEVSGGGWRHHPATRMWLNYEYALADYGAAICTEWRNRGYKDSLLSYFTERIAPVPTPRPFWFGDNHFHSLHRGTLLFKNPEWYGRFGWTESPEYRYYWPVRNLDNV